MVIDWAPQGSDEYPGGVVLRDSAGGIVRVTLGPGDVDCRPYYTASKEDWIVKAIVASEDGTFFEHCGVRPLSVLRAAWQNITSRRRISGASTITMQTVRLINPHKKSYLEKWIEAFRALKLERQKDKIWIISQYLNRAPFGSNFVGVEAAASGWFGKSAKDLTLCEAALLAGMVQAPSRFRLDRRYERAIKRRDYVLDRMVEVGFATSEQVEAARSVSPEIRRGPRPFKHPHYCDWFLQLYGEHLRGGMDIRMPLDPNIQARAYDIISQAANAGGFDAAMVVRKVDTSEIVAMAVSGDYFSPKEGQVNTALAPRSAGSTLKPILAAAAMDAGIIAPSEKLIDIPKAYKGYTPANFDSKWRGFVSLDDALVLSLNVPFVSLLEKFGVKRFEDCLWGMGFVSMGWRGEERGLGMAIGNVEVTLEELTGAYALLARAANGGRDGVLSPASAYLVSEALSSPQRSLVALGHVADVELPRFAWKTGTSSAYRDAWTVAWNPEYIVGVWCGHISGRIGDRGIVGAKVAAPLVWEMIRALYPSNVSPWFSKPSQISQRQVCALSGMVASIDCPEKVEGNVIAGVTTARMCQMHRRNAEGNVAEVLPPELEAFLRKAEKAKRLSISKPMDGAHFKLVSGMAQQKIVCKVSGNPDGEKLWWFCNGSMAGETTGSEKFVMEMKAGKHHISCTTAEGISASVNIEVLHSDR